MTESWVLPPAAKAEYMKQSPEIAGPECPHCHKQMEWQSVQLVGAQPMNIFHCAACDRIAAAISATSESISL
jgi:hypothetical protein